MRNHLRHAIAMIELIFAIVIMGIVMMSAPMLISTATQSAYVGVQQESVAAVASEIGMILTQHWDENDTNISAGAPVLAVSPQGHPDLNEVVVAGFATGIRAGCIPGNDRSFTNTSGDRFNATLPINLGSDGAILDPTGDDDIDDYIGASNLINEEAVITEEGDYIDQQIILTTAVSYISDTPISVGGYNAPNANTLTLPFTQAATPRSTNIKRISVTLTTANANVEIANKNIILQAFSCNIGSYKLQEASF